MLGVLPWWFVAAVPAAKAAVAEVATAVVVVVVVVVVVFISAVAEDFLLARGGLLGRTPLTIAAKAGP